MSLVPAEYNFTIYQGADFFKRITYNVNSALQDVTGYSASLSIKNPNNGRTLLTIDTGSNGGIVLGGVVGTIDLTIGSSVTSNLGWTNGSYELFITDPTPRTDVLMLGVVRVVTF